MTYLRTLALLILAACNPGRNSSSSSGASSTDASATTTAPAEPTTEPTATSNSTTDPVTTGSTSEPTSSATAPDDTTTGALACAERPDFVASFTAWEAARDANANTYYYALRRGPGGLVPPDFCIYRTLVAVADGEVIERRFEIVEVVGEPECDEAFTEKGDEVGTGTADFLAPAVTVDALYSACCDMVLHIEPADEYTVTFSTDKDGLMKTCYYVANGCADGCEGGPLGAALDFEALVFGAPPPAP